VGSPIGIQVKKWEHDRSERKRTERGGKYGDERRRKERKKE